MTQQGMQGRKRGSAGPELRYGPPDPASSAPASQGSPQPSRRRVPPAVWPIAALVGAVAVGAAVGVVVTALGAAGRNDDGWGELGAFLLGMVLGVLAFAAAYLVGLALAARLSLPRGQRVLPVVLSVSIPAVVAATATALSAAADDAGANFPEPMAAAGFLGALAAGPAAFAWSATRRGRRRLAVGTAVLLVLMTAATGVQVAHARHEVSVAAARIPFVLFAGGTAEAPYDGWRRDTFTTTTISDDVGSIARAGVRAHLRYFTGVGLVSVTMHSDIGPCVTSDRYTCLVTGTLQGNEIRRYERVAQYGSYPQSDAFDVLVRPDGSAVSVSEESIVRPVPGRPDVPGTQVLTDLVRVDRQQFEHATGSRLRLQ